MARMATPGGLYNGGAVVFNSQPSLQYYSMMLQHKQAKDEALGRYYQDLGKNINSAGMRTQDIEGGWNQKVADWQTFYNQNAKAIQNPMRYGPEAQNEFYSRLRDIHNDIDRSKEAGTRENMVRQKMLDPKWREQTTDQDMAIAQNMGRPIYDPQHYKDGHTIPYGPEDFSFEAPRFDLNQQKTAVNSLTQGLPRGESPHPLERPLIDKEARTVTVPMLAGYDKSTYDKIIERGVNIYRGSQSAQKFFENELHNPNDLEALNKPFKQYFGKDISSPEDVARAWAMQQVPQIVRGKDKVRGWTDQDASLARQEEFYDYREAHKEAKTAADDATVENFMKGLEDKAKAGGVLPYKTSDGSVINTYRVPLTAELKKMFTVRVGAHLADPDEVRVNAETGDYLPIFYEKKDGVPVVVGNNVAISKSIPTQAADRETVKAGIAKLLSKRAVKQLQGGAAPATSSKTAEDKASELLKKYGGIQ